MNENRQKPEYGGELMDSKIWYIPAKNDRLDKNVGIYCRVSTHEKE